MPREWSNKDEKQTGKPRTRKDLYKRAKQLNVPGRSRMTTRQLERAIAA